jgi:hypothetical protein
MPLNTSQVRAIIAANVPDNNANLISALSGRTAMLAISDNYANKTTDKNLLGLYGWSNSYGSYSPGQGVIYSGALFQVIATGGTTAGSFISNEWTFVNSFSGQTNQFILKTQGIELGTAKTIVQLADDANLNSLVTGFYHTKAVASSVGLAQPYPVSGNGMLEVFNSTTNATGMRRYNPLPFNGIFYTKSNSDTNWQVCAVGTGSTINYTNGVFKSGPNVMAGGPNVTAIQYVGADVTSSFAINSIPNVFIDSLPTRTINGAEQILTTDSTGQLFKIASGASFSNLTYVTTSELTNRINNSQLVPGSFYAVVNPFQGGTIILPAMSPNSLGSSGTWLRNTNIKPFGAIFINSGTTGQYISGITINGSNLISGPIQYDTDNNTTASLIVSNIASNTSITGWDARAINNAVVFIWSTATNSIDSSFINVDSNFYDIYNPGNIGIGQNPTLESYSVEVNTQFFTISSCFDSIKNVLVNDQPFSPLLQDFPWGHNSITNLTINKNLGFELYINGGLSFCQIDETNIGQTMILGAYLRGLKIDNSTFSNNYFYNGNYNETEVNNLSTFSNNSLLNGTSNVLKVTNASYFTDNYFDTKTINEVKLNNASYLQNQNGSFYSVDVNEFVYSRSSSTVEFDVYGLTQTPAGDLVMKTNLITFDGTSGKGLAGTSINLFDIQASFYVPTKLITSTGSNFVGTGTTIDLGFGAGTSVLQKTFSSGSTAGSIFGNASSVKLINPLINSYSSGVSGVFTLRPLVGNLSGDVSFTLVLQAI